MKPEHTHILVVTVKLLAQGEASSNTLYQKGMMYDYSSILETDESKIDPAINKIFHYSDIFLCLVNLDSAFDGLGVNEKTARLEPMIGSLFKDVSQVYFSWMIRPKCDVVNPSLSPIIQYADGSSGGANIGSRGG